MTTVMMNLFCLLPDNLLYPNSTVSTRIYGIAKQVAIKHKTPDQFSAFDDNTDFGFFSFHLTNCLLKMKYQRLLLL